MIQILDHVERALSRVTQRFKDKPRFLAVIRALGKQAQALEDGFWGLYVAHRLESAEGVQLDILGKIVGEERQGFVDADFRVHISARVKLNLSNGTIPDVLGVLKLLLPEGTPLELVEYPPLGFHVRIRTTTITPEYARLLANFLRRARAGGVRGVLEFVTLTEENTFTLEGPGDGLGLGDAEDSGYGGGLAGALD